MFISENQSLRDYNTFKIDVKAKFFVIINSFDDLRMLIKEPIFNKHPFLIIGEGSNILFTKDFDGILILNNIKGYYTPVIYENFITIKVNSGENWNNFVNYCVENSWGGVENLVAIPGTIGASPVQNIGAYGCEAKDVIIEVGAISMSTGEYKSFANQECKFNYRSSVFKNQLKNMYFISDVTFKLNLNQSYSIDYGEIRNELSNRCLEINIFNIKTVISDIRSRKLPDPKIVGNAGSFFKNPFVSAPEFEKLRQNYPDIKAFVGDNGYKLAAAWLIEQCGWRGKSIGQAAVHENQALVLINKGKASGNEILQLSKKIQDSVLERFGVKIEPEVNII